MLRRYGAILGSLALAMLLVTPEAMSRQKANKLDFRDEAMLAKLLLKYRENKTLMQTVRGKMSVTVDEVTISADLATTMQMAQPNKFRIESEVTFLGTKKRGVAVSDGKTVWEWDQDAQKYSEQPFSMVAKTEDKFSDWLTSRTNADLTPILFLEGASGKMLGLTPEAAKSIEVKDYPTKEIDGRAMYVVPVPINESDGTKGQATLYVDTEEMLVRRCRFQIKPARDKKAKQSMNVDFVLNYDKITTGTELPEDTFAFAPPEGAQKVKTVKPVFDRAFE